MNRTNDILEELKSMGSNLGSYPRTMPYAVPDDYFENMAASVGKVINEVNEIDVSPSWSKTMPYNVPAGYFESLADNIIAKTHSKDVLPGLPQEVPFTAPTGYFEALPAQILTAVKAAEPVKKVRKNIPLKITYASASIKWAAAAVLLICVGLGGFMFFHQQSPPPERMLASVPGNVIEDYIQHTYRIDVHRIEQGDISNLQLDNKEIIQYLNETGWDVAE